MPARSAEASSPPRHDDRRRHERIFEARRQLHLVVDGRRLETINWSSGGCLVHAPEHWKVGDILAATLETRHGVPRGSVVSKIVRIDDRGRAGLCFTRAVPAL